MEKTKVSFKVLNDKDEELRVITIEVDPGKKLKQRAETEALKQIADGEKIEFIPVTPETPKSGKKFKYTFEFEFLVNDESKRKASIDVEEDTHELAWRKSVDLATAEATEGETVRYTGKNSVVALTEESI